MRRILLLVAVLGLLPACGGSGGSTPSGPTTSLTIPGQVADELLAFTEVVFGVDGYVAITNFGDRSVSLLGHYVYQRPYFLALQAVRLQPGETMWVIVGRPPARLPNPAPVAVLPSEGRIGELRAAGGDLALFASGVLDQPTSLIDYVRWGEAGEGTEAVAVAAGKWVADETVPTSADTIAIEAPDGADGPAGWSVE